MRIRKLYLHTNLNDKNQIFLGKATWLNLQELAKPLMDLLVQDSLHWWARVGNDRLIADGISGCREAINIGQKLAEKNL